MKELLQAVVAKNFPLFEEGVNQVLTQKVKTLIEGYRPIAVNKFLAESENFSRHQGGEYIFEDGTYADISKEEIQGIFEAKNAFEWSLIGVMTALAAASLARQVHETAAAKKEPVPVEQKVEAPPVKYAAMRESLDYFLSASKKNFDAYKADPQAVVQALDEADVMLPHVRAKNELFETLQEPISFKSTNKVLNESWKNDEAKQEPTFENYLAHRNVGKSHEEAVAGCQNMSESRANEYATRYGHVLDYWRERTPS